MYTSASGVIVLSPVPVEESLRCGSTSVLLATQQVSYMLLLMCGPVTLTHPKYACTSEYMHVQ